jgi:hypothetical protein
MRIIGLILLSVLLCGCRTTQSVQVHVPAAVLLPEDRIFTLPANTEISTLSLDGKPLGVIQFPGDMKLVSPDVLVRQEVKLNDAIVSKIKSDKDKQQVTGIFGGLIALLTTIGGIFLKMKADSTTKKT